MKNKSMFLLFIIAMMFLGAPWSLLMNASIQLGWNTAFLGWSTGVAYLIVLVIGIFEIPKWENDNDNN